VHGSSQECRVQRWIGLRRVAGGLGKGQQNQLAKTVLSGLIHPSGQIRLRNKSEEYEYSEKIRALAAMERLEHRHKIRLGDAILERILSGDAGPADFWALARIGARQMVYATVADILPRDVCEGWICKILDSSLPPSEQVTFLFQHLGRKSDHREVNISEEIVARVIEYCAPFPGGNRVQDLLCGTEILTREEQEAHVGDALPAGLTIEQEKR
jgi:hypothetical protein